MDATTGAPFNLADLPSNSICTAARSFISICPKNPPKSCPRDIYGFKIGASSAVTEAIFNAFVIAPFCKYSAICSAICKATFSCASIVEAPRCGVATTFGCSNKILSFAGSSEKTSSATPETWPELRAA